MIYIIKHVLHNQHQFLHALLSLYCSE